MLQFIQNALLLIALGAAATNAQSSENPLTYNGGAVLAMAGNGCVAVAVDRRFAQGPALIHTPPRSVMTIVPDDDVFSDIQDDDNFGRNYCLVAWHGFQPHVQTVQLELAAQLGYISGSRYRSVSPRSVASLLSHLLYQKRGFYVEPVLVGLRPSNDDHHRMEPYLCSMDCIGAQSRSQQFCVAGPSTLYGAAEALWRPNLSPADLVQVTARAFVRGVERDCLSGYGATVYLVTAEQGIQEFPLSMRND